jgi:hypothetical protein
LTRFIEKVYNAAMRSAISNQLRARNMENTTAQLVPGKQAANGSPQMSGKLTADR